MDSGFATGGGKIIAGGRGHGGVSVNISSPGLSRTLPRGIFLALRLRKGRVTVTKR